MSTQRAAAAADARQREAEEKLQRQAHNFLTDIFFTGTIQEQHSLNPSSSHGSLNDLAGLDDDEDDENNQYSLNTEDRLEEAFNDGKNIAFSMRGCPVMMFSLVGRKRRRKDAEGREEGDASDAVEISANSEALQDGELREMSYANLLSSQSVSADHPHDHLGDDGDDDGDHRGDGRHRLGTYDPTFLDDPEMRTGKHRAVLNLQGCMFSLLNFVTEKQLKNDLNDQFWDKHDFWLQDRDISLSKIRKLKTLMVDVALDVSTTSPPVGFSQQQPMLEEETVATAIVYFEKLVLKGKVSKSNRKSVAAACLVLAIKFRDALSEEADALKQVLEVIEDHFDVSKKDIFAAEFRTLVNLSFHLHVDEPEYEPHILYIQSVKELKGEDVS